MSFPTLSLSEIISAFKDFGYPYELTFDDLNKPIPNKVHHIYEFILSYFIHINREHIYEAIREPLSNDIYQYRVLTGVFKDTLEQIMRCSAIYDFSDRDFLNPTAERFKRILSGIINFGLFETEQGPLVLHPLEDSLTDLQNQRDDLMNRISKSAKEKSDLQHKYEEEERIAAELIPQIEGYKATILECKDMTDPLEQRRAELLKTRSTICEQNRTAVTEVQRLENECNRLSTRIARSPEKVRTAIESLQKTLTSELSSIGSLETNSHYLEKRIKSIDKYEKDLHQCLKLSDEWEVENMKLEEVKKNLNGLNDEYESKVSELNEIEKKSSQAQRRTEVMQEQLSRVHSGIHRKRKAAIERQTKANEKHSEELNLQIEYEKESQSLTNEKAMLISWDKDLAEDYIRSMKKGQAAYDTLRSELLHYCMKHTTALAAVETKLQNIAEGNGNPTD
ncbi:Nuf2 family-domain-containing protein [Melampsora americana]|nr:Nuf2 family-domain-containing protein [Melampsora americana]